jgi:hypothetical protein
LLLLLLSSSCELLMHALAALSRPRSSVGVLWRPGAAVQRSAAAAAVGLAALLLLLLSLLLLLLPLVLGSCANRAV